MWPGPPSISEPVCRKLIKERLIPDSNELDAHLLAKNDQGFLNQILK